MKNLFLTFFMSIGLISSHTSFAVESSPTVGAAPAVAVAAIPAVINNAEKIINSVNPITGTTVDERDFWCISNEWETRDKIMKAKGYDWETRAFSRHTRVAGFIKGATWYCYVK